MTETVIRQVRVGDGREPVTITIRHGRIAEIGADRGAHGQVVDGAGGLVVPALVDPHIHLDAVLTEGFPAPNRSGTLLEGIERWSQRKPYLTEDDICRRAEEVIRWHMAHGVLNIRSHVDICDPHLTALRALLKVREAIQAVVTLQLVAFPQDGIYCFPDGPELLEEAIRLGADVVGGIPHYEWTREDGLRELELAFGLARKYGRPLDIHCDETDDDQSRFLETVANLTRQNGLGGRVTASHATALASYNDPYAFKLIRMVKAAGVHIVANPLDNIVLQGRFDTYRKRRGMTRVKELLAEGVTVAAGHDSVMDPWYPLGSGNQWFVASMLAHIGQLTGSDELPAAWQAVTTAGARVMQLRDYGVAEGMRADLAIYDVPGPADLIRLMPLPRWVLAAGQVVAHTPPANSTVWWHGVPQTVSFFRS
ncbi:MAG: cytosine deaminase [Thermaerobacter sp.]|nr:cytosine deaminase [Thermaerobacter sp.]